jgi:hypothetical protein
MLPILGVACLSRHFPGKSGEQRLITRQDGPKVHMKIL